MLTVLFDSVSFDVFFFDRGNEIWLTLLGRNHVYLFIESTSDLGNGNVSPALFSSESVPMVYAVFNTPRYILRVHLSCSEFRFARHQLDLGVFVYKE
jgi:hypothetical protein